MSASLLALAITLLTVGPGDGALAHGAGQRGVGQPIIAPPPPWAALTLENCPAQLASAGVTEFTMLPEDYTETLETSGGPQRCYVPQAMRYVRGPGNVKYTTYMLMNCRMAVAMARFEEVLQRVARAHFGRRARVRTVVTLGAYACRPLRKNHTVMSQHGLGNAVDLRRLIVDRFGAVDIEHDWAPDGTRRGDRASAFLHGLVNVLRDERVFMNVITPTDDARGHKNHLHVDLDPVRPSLAVAPLLDEPIWDADCASELEHEAAAPAARVLDVHFEGESVVPQAEEH